MIDELTATRPEQKPAIIFLDAEGTCFPKRSCPGVQALLRKIRRDNPHVLFSILTGGHSLDGEFTGDGWKDLFTVFRPGDSKGHLLVRCGLELEYKNEGMKSVVEQLVELGITSSRIEPSRMVFIGDHPYDILSAYKYGLPENYIRGDDFNPQVTTIAVGISFRLQAFKNCLENYFRIAEIAPTHHFPNLADTDAVLKALAPALGLNLEEAPAAAPAHAMAVSQSVEMTPGSTRGPRGQ